jgi:hypothetical protein
MSQEISPENQAIIENLHVLIARAEKEKEWRKAIRALSPKPKREWKAA